MFKSAGFNIEGSSLILEWVGYSIFNSDNVNFVLKTNRWRKGVGKVSFVVCVLWGTITLADGEESLIYGQLMRVETEEISYRRLSSCGAM